MEEDPYPLFVLLQSILQPLNISVALAMFASVLLLICSGFISSSEVAFFALSPTDIDELKKEENDKNKRLLGLLNNPDKLLGTILIANNFVNVAIVIVSTYITVNLFDFSSAPWIGVVFQVVIVTFLLLLFGEILPKIYATHYTKKLALRMTGSIFVLSKILSPFSVVLVKSSRLVSPRGLSGQNLSKEELSTALELTSKELRGDLEMLEGVIKFGNLSVVEIMTARVDVVDVDIKSDFQKVLSVIVESGYSRIPVYHKSPDNIKGILYIKDLLPHLHKGSNFRWQSLIRPAYYVPESKKISDLLKEFQSNKIHLAVVVDEYGGTAGIITLEDILEEIVGEISDEVDIDGTIFNKQSDGSLLFDGKVLLNDFIKVTNIDEKLINKVKGEADTLAGLILELKGEMPMRGEQIETEDALSFEIVEVDARRIVSVKYFPFNSDEERS